MLDDPLSAVDAHVGQHIWSHCVQGLLARKTRVLVTHHMHWLPSSDLIAVLQGGKITHLGTYEALESQVGHCPSEHCQQDIPFMSSTDAISSLGSCGVLKNALLMEALSYTGRLPQI